MLGRVKKFFSSRSEKRQRVHKRSQSDPSQLSEPFSRVVSPVPPQLAETTPVNPRLSGLSQYLWRRSLAASSALSPSSAWSSSFAGLPEEGPTFHFYVHSSMPDVGRQITSKTSLIPTEFSRIWTAEQLSNPHFWNHFIAEIRSTRFDLAEAVSSDWVRSVSKRRRKRPVPKDEDCEPIRRQPSESSAQHKQSPAFFRLHTSKSRSTSASIADQPTPFPLEEMSKRLARRVERALMSSDHAELDLEIVDESLHPLFRDIMITVIPTIVEAASIPRPFSEMFGSMDDGAVGRAL